MYDFTLTETQLITLKNKDKIFAVAPMMNWTDFLFEQMVIRASAQIPCSQKSKSIHRGRAACVLDGVVAVHSVSVD